jgi:hypothetical protein
MRCIDPLLLRLHDGPSYQIPVSGEIHQPFCAVDNWYRYFRDDMGIRIYNAVLCRVESHISGFDAYSLGYELFIDGLLNHLRRVFAEYF